LVVVAGFFEYRGLSYPGDNCWVSRPRTGGYVRIPGSYVWPPHSCSPLNHCHWSVGVWTGWTGSGADWVIWLLPGYIFTAVIGVKSSDLKGKLI
jgi:hypothetical protein